MRLVVFLFLAGCVHGEESFMSEEFYRNKMSNNMEHAAAWILNEGLQIVHLHDAATLSRTLVDRWAVQLAVKEPGIDDGYELAYFPVAAKGMHYDINCLHRVTGEKATYEYWLINKRGADWFGNRRAMFYIMKTADVHAKREQVHSSDQFFDEYEVDDVKLTLPLTDLQLLYRMEAWKYPDSYAGSKLPDTEVSLDQRGYFVVGSGWQKAGRAIRGIFGARKE